jgi:hypothetical protein
MKQRDDESVRASGTHLPTVTRARGKHHTYTTRPNRRKDSETDKQLTCSLIDDGNATQLRRTKQALQTQPTHGTMSMAKRSTIGVVSPTTCAYRNTHFVNGYMKAYWMK